MSLQNEFLEFFRNLFETASFPARWVCGEWSDFHGWLYISSNLLVWSAYFTIPLLIINYISKRKDIKFHRGYFLFAAFILSCGLTHLLDAIIFWVPVYRVNAIVLFITGLLSWTTVFYMLKMLPVAFSLKTTNQLQAEIDSRKRTEEELIVTNDQLNQAESIARMGSWEWDIKTNKVRWSKGLFNIYEVDETEATLSYETFIQHVHPEDRTYVNSLIQESIKNKQFTDYFHRIVTSSGKQRTLHAKGAVILDDNGDIIKMLGTSQDVSEQKKAEQELLIKSKNLQESNSELQKFAYIASHDLKEPLRKIKTFMSRFETDYDHLLQEENSRNYLNKINHAANRMQKLMDDILNFSRISSANISFEEINLTKVVEEVLFDFEVKIEHSKAIIKVGTMPVVEANESQIAQLFGNLISNGIKFSTRGEMPRIEITSEILNGNSVTNSSLLKENYRFGGWDESYHWAKEKFCKIIVRDYGIGFDNEYNSKIFSPFERLHGLNEYEGTGVGLAICKKIVDRHHGIISAESSKENGTAFTVILPVSQKNFGLTDWD